MIFSNHLKANNIISNYAVHTTRIYSGIIDTNDTSNICSFLLLDLFLLLVLTSNRNIDIVYNFILGKINILTNKILHSKVIVGVYDSETLVEVKKSNKRNSIY